MEAYQLKLWGTLFHTSEEIILDTGETYSDLNNAKSEQKKLMDSLFNDINLCDIKYELDDDNWVFTDIESGETWDSLKGYEMHYIMYNVGCYGDLIDIPRWEITEIEIN